MLININKELYVIRENTSDKEVYSTKIVDSLPDDFNEYNYKYINGELVRAELIPVKTLDDFKAEKFFDLEIYIQGKRSEGIEWNGQVWSIDEECEKNLTSQITMLSFAPSEQVAWFSKTQVNQLTIDEFEQLALVISNAISQSKLQYYAFKNAIENAETKEALDEIVFE